MKILYVDTSSDYLYSGIVINATLVSECQEKLGKDLSKEALPRIISVFNKADITPKDLDKIILVTGPGSFTGIRIGVTIAKIIAWSLNIPIVPISGLTAMAISNKQEGYSMPLIDARRGFVYGALYDNDINPIIDDIHIPLDELTKKSHDYSPITVITNNEIETEYNISSYEPDILKIVTYFKNKEGLNPHMINPIYLKKTEAEEKANLW
mgnify:FL=1